MCRGPSNSFSKHNPSTFQAKLLMAATSQSDGQQRLADLWLQAKSGCLAPWAEAKAWGLRVAWKEIHGERTYGLLDPAQASPRPPPP